MSSGSAILAKTETEGGYVLVREYWGPRYVSDGQLIIEFSHGQTSIILTPEELEDVVEQVRRTRYDIERALR